MGTVKYDARLGVLVSDTETKKVMEQDQLPTITGESAPANLMAQTHWTKSLEEVKPYLKEVRVGKGILDVKDINQTLLVALVSTNKTVRLMFPDDSFIRVSKAGVAMGWIPKTTKVVQ